MPPAVLSAHATIACSYPEHHIARPLTARRPLLPWAMLCPSGLLYSQSSLISYPNVSISLGCNVEKSKSTPSPAAAATFTPALPTAALPHGHGPPELGELCACGRAENPGCEHHWHCHVARAHGDLSDQLVAAAAPQPAAAAAAIPPGQATTAAAVGQQQQPADRRRPSSQPNPRSKWVRSHRSSRRRQREWALMTILWRP